MQVEVASNPDFGHLEIVLDQGQSIICESGAMAAMDSDLQLDTKMMGGFLPALWRKMVAGESLLSGVYTSNRAGSRLWLSPAIPGAVIAYKMEGQPLLLTSGSFLACDSGIQLGTRFGGLRAMFSGEGMFFIEASGSGTLWFNSYGSVIEKEIDGELIVDTGHVVAWEPTLTWTVTGMGNLFSTIFSGEGLVLKFTGRGKVWLQTRSMSGLAAWLAGYCR
ncbi:TIGR00266 family protein [bacterium]|nr:TIGR00266 family protein [bacterium]